jgi:hypothetical protein
MDSVVLKKQQDDARTTAEQDDAGDLHSWTLTDTGPATGSPLADRRFIL